MPSRIPVGIAGVGAYAPERVVTNDHFVQMLDTSDEWIVQRTGIRERRYAADDEATSDLCLKASAIALERAGIGPEDLDLIITGTVTPDHILPSCAALIQARLGAVNAAAFDVTMACAGFLAAVHIAEGLVASGGARRVLAIGAETLSRYLDFEDRTSCILFGDAAGAAVVTPLEECNQGEILRSTLGTDGTGFEFIHVPAGGSRLPTCRETVEAREHLIRIRGREVYRFATSTMSKLIAEMAEGHDPDEIGLVVPHQVNLRIIQAAMGRLGWPLDKCVVNIEKYGNTSAASVPLALQEALEDGRVEKGKLLIMVAFGGGLTWGANLVRW